MAERKRCYRCQSTDLQEINNKIILCNNCGWAYRRGLKQTEMRAAKLREQGSGAWESLDWRNLPDA